MSQDDIEKLLGGFAASAEPTPAPQPVPEPAPTPVPSGAKMSQEEIAKFLDELSASAESAPAPQPVPEPVPAPTPAPIPEPQPIPEPVPIPTPAPEPVVKAEPMPKPEPTPEPVSPKDPNLLEDGSKYINVMEHLVREKMPRYVKMFGLCQCPRCMADVTALALSSLPVKYVVIPSFAEGPFMEIYRSRYSSAVTAQILYACKVVMDTPRHTLE